LKQWQQAKDGPWKSAFGPVEPDAREAMGTFLTSCVGAPRLVEAKALFHSLGCRGCHKIGGVGGDDGPDLTHAGQKDPARLNFSHVSGERTVAQWHAEHLRDPAKIVPDSKMPKAGLSEEQVGLLTLYLLSLRRSDVPEAYWPKDRIRAERLGEREFATDGSTLFGTFCAGCHGRSGEGRRFPGAVPFPAVGNPDFLAAASDDFLAQTIRRGRPGRRMPAWDAKSGGLRSEEIQKIIDNLRRNSGIAEPKQAHPERRWVHADAKAGEQLFVRNCAGCHGLHGEGLQAPALSHPVLQAVATDDYFVETIGRGRRGTDMNGFRNPSSVHPTLSEADIQSIVAFIRTWETQK
jgi:cbb3-type cytochrome c oxidase subunit III